VTLGGPASAAEETSAEIAWVKNNVVVTGANPDEATIMAKYRCTGEGVHLWASVKQGPNIDEDTNSSTDAESWYETPEGPVPVCDGKNHVIRYTVTRVDGFDTLEKGRGWVQFVFFYMNTDGEFTRAADVGWANVKVPGGH
jgi:hypothetical protein